jgi:hypothetical protein
MLVPWMICNYNIEMVTQKCFMSILHVLMSVKLESHQLGPFMSKQLKTAIYRKSGIPQHIILPRGQSMLVPWTICDYNIKTSTQ